VLIKKELAAIYSNTLIKILTSEVKKDNQIRSKVTSHSMHSNLLRMLWVLCLTMPIGRDSSKEILSNLQPQGNHTKTLISLAINLTKAPSNLISSLQRKKVKCVNQTLSHDPTFWAKMMELSKEVTVNFINQYPREKKENGRALYLKDLLRMYQEENYLNKKVLARVVCTEILKDLHNGRRKSISQLN